MTDSLNHRGPDDRGVWLDPGSGVGLGHRRLSILDLSPEGHQPMVSADQRYWLVYNGEIYNYLELREQLEGLGHQFRGRSDTEVLLACLVEWGLPATLPKLNGMFALGVWDCQRKRLYLARDRYGKKPLYYGRIGTQLYFASELGAFRCLPEFSPSLDSRALALYLQYGYVPTPYSIYQGFRKLPPATWMELGAGDQLRPIEYWRLPAAERGGTEPVSISQVESTLLAAVERRLVSDVPLGAFLSGGLDSSLIVSLMCQVSPLRVRTFSLGFAEASHDEAGFARQVATHLGTDHTEYYVTPAQALDVVPLLPQLYSEPFADSSQIPTYLVSKLARQQVTVALSGDGGDELFGGYNRYLYGPRLWKMMSRCPLPLRRVLSRLLRMLPFGRLSRLLDGRLAYPQEKLTKLSEVLNVASAEELYARLVTLWPDSESLMVRPPLSPGPADLPRCGGDLAAWMMRMDCQTYLCDDILVKVDRASMGVSLEARAPFLDPQVCELASRLRLDQKIRDGQGKWILRQILDRRVPRALLDRPKAGFSLPLGEWLRHQLRDWAESLLFQVKSGGVIHFEPVQARWRQHLAGQRDWSHSLWVILMYQAWFNSTLAGDRSA